MKFQHLVIIGMVAIFSVGCAKEIASNQTEPQTQTTSTTANTGSESGSFKAGEHPTKGKVSVITEQGKRYLKFDENFKTDKGPDLFVILHRSDAPPISGIKEQDYVSVARLEKISGTQRYALPDNLKLTEFKSVAIWCKKFNATFGYAPING